MTSKQHCILAVQARCPSNTNKNSVYSNPCCPNESLLSYILRLTFLKNLSSIFQCCIHNYNWSIFMHVYSTTHTIVLLLFWNSSGTTRMSRYQRGKTRKGKANLDLLEQEIVSGSGICGAICKSAPHPRQPCQHPTTKFLRATA